MLSQSSFQYRSVIEIKEIKHRQTQVSNASVGYERDADTRMGFWVSQFTNKQVQMERDQPEKSRWTLLKIDLWIKEVDGVIRVGVNSSWPEAHVDRAELFHVWCEIEWISKGALLHGDSISSLDMPLFYFPPGKKQRRCAVVEMSPLWCISVKTLALDRMTVWCLLQYVIVFGFTIVVTIVLQGTQKHEITMYSWKDSWWLLVLKLLNNWPKIIKI